MEDVKYDGMPVKLGDKVMIVPPLTFKQLKSQEMKAKLLAMQKIGPRAEDAQFDALRDVVHACLVRNYPDLLAETLEEALTMGNLKAIMQALFGVEALATVGEQVGSQQQ